MPPSSLGYVSYAFILTKLRVSGYNQPINLPFLYVYQLSLSILVKHWIFSTLIGKIL